MPPPLGYNNCPCLIRPYQTPIAVARLTIEHHRDAHRPVEERPLPVRQRQEIQALLRLRQRRVRRRARPAEPGHPALPAGQPAGRRATGRAAVAQQPRRCKPCRDQRRHCPADRQAGTCHRAVQTANRAAAGQRPGTQQPVHGTAQSSAATKRPTSAASRPSSWIRNSPMPGTTWAISTNPAITCRVHSNTMKRHSSSTAPTPSCTSMQARSASYSATLKLRNNATAMH